MCHYLPVPPPLLKFLCDFFNYRRLPYSCIAYSCIAYSCYSCRAFYLCTSIVAFEFLRPPISFPVPSSMHLPRTPVPVLPLSCAASHRIFTFVSSRPTLHTFSSSSFNVLHTMGDSCVQFSILRQHRSQIFECVYSLYCIFL